MRLRCLLFGHDVRYIAGYVGPPGVRRRSTTCPRCGATVKNAIPGDFYRRIRGR